jgi:hypothetical protein
VSSVCLSFTADWILGGRVRDVGELGELYGELLHVKENLLGVDPPHEKADDDGGHTDERDVCSF